MLFSVNFHQESQNVQVIFSNTKQSFDADFKTDQNIPVKFRSSKQTIEACFQCFQTVKVMEEVEHYMGSYDVTPLITSQILATNQKFMDDDVRIDMIPTREEYNAQGGVTFIVG